MKVLHIFNSINHSGAEIMYASAAPLFQKNKIELYAFSTGEKPGTYYDEFESAGFKLFHKSLVPKKCYSYYLKMIPFFWAFYFICRKNAFDVVHIHRRHLFWMFALVAKLAGTKSTVRTVHNVFRPVWYRYPSYYLSRKFAKYFLGTKITSISKSVYDNEIFHFHNKTFLIPNWFNDKTFYPVTPEDKAKKRLELNLGFSEFILISSGSCLPVKRHTDILKAVANLKDKIPQLKYIHLGSGALESKEKETSNNLGISEHVIFAGNVKNVQDYIAASDIFIMPSEYEGIGISALEAMACGKPVIFYNSPGLRDLLDNTDSKGFLVDKDPKYIVDKVLYFYNNPQKANKMGDNAASFVQQEYSMNKSVLEFIKLYHS